MAKAVGSGSHSRYPEQRLELTTLAELASRLEALGRAQMEARIALGDADYVSASERLFTAVARVNPMYAAGEVRAIAKYLER